MDALADLRVPCPRCRGARFRPEVLEVTWRGLGIDAFLAEPVAGLRTQLSPGPLRDAADSLAAVGLGHVALGRPTRSLSGGELQRLGLAQHLRDDGRRTLHLLDEPGRGLHEADIHRLVGLVDALVGRGDLIVATVHRRSLVSAADLVLQLGPGAGPAGGRWIGGGALRGSGPAAG
jgi:excinuclease ABC subunit A